MLKNALWNLGIWEVRGNVSKNSDKSQVREEASFRWIKQEQEGNSGDSKKDTYIDLPRLTMGLLPDKLIVS